MKLADVLDRVVARIERAEVLDKPGAALVAASEKIPGSQLLDDVASGAVIGHPLHPLLVAIPIGSWTSAAVFDLLGDEDAARTLTGIGVLAAIPTMISGHEDWRYTAGAEQRVGTVHAALNNVAVWSYVASWFARRAGRRGMGIALSAVGGTALGAAGYLGGHLAYAMGVGVDTTAFQHSGEEWTDVAGLADLTIDELHAAEADGVPVVLLRQGPAEVAVLAGRCTHRGAPLAEGTFEDGCIVCPWHGAAFAPDGSVVRGPASRPEPAYEVRIAADRVLVRRSDEPRTFRTNPVGI